MNQFEHLTISRRSKKEYGIWDLTQNLYKGKIQALEAKLGLFWDHFWNFLGLCRYFHENERKNMQKRQKTRSRYFPFQKIYLTVRKYDRAREYQKHAHDTLCMSK